MAGAAVTPEHQQLISILANAGRLGPFCVWPHPPRMAEDANRIDPLTRGPDGRPVTIPLRPIQFVDADWVAKGWTEMGERLARAERIVAEDEAAQQYPPCPHCGSTLRPGASTCPVCGPHAHGRP